MTVPPTVWDQVSAHYDRQLWLERGAVLRAVALLASRHGERILDVGTGTGEVLRQLARHPGRLQATGVDQSAAMLARVPDLPAGWSVRVADARSLPFSDGAFDAVTAAYLLQVLSDTDIPGVAGELLPRAAPGWSAGHRSRRRYRRAVRCGCWDQRWISWRGAIRVATAACVPSTPVRPLSRPASRSPRCIGACGDIYRSAYCPPARLTLPSVDVLLSAESFVGRGRSNNAMIRIAVLGGPYANPFALRAVLDDAEARRRERIFCLGDLGGFGADCDGIWPLLTDRGVQCIAGNYDVAIARGDADCGCGYADERDNHYAQLIYDHTLASTSPAFAAWMRDLPLEHRETIGGVDVHMVHGSPLAINDFVWESLSDDELRMRVALSGADVLLCTHTGIPWQRHVDGTLVVNVGAVGRPANDGRTGAWYAVLELDGDHASAELVPVAYDRRAQAQRWPVRRRRASACSSSSGSSRGWASAVSTRQSRRRSLSSCPPGCGGGRTRR